MHLLLDLFTSGHATDVIDSAYSAKRPAFTADFGEVCVDRIYNDQSGYFVQYFVYGYIWKHGFISKLSIHFALALLSFISVFLLKMQFKGIFEY